MIRMKNNLAAIAALLLSVCPMGALAQEKNHNFEISKNLEIFTAVYRNLDLMYVDSLDPGEVIGTGIKAMMRSLDPYTVYYPQEDVKDLKTMFTGKYAGIGSTIRKNFKTGNVYVEMPYVDMPAYEVGLRKGDVIQSIDDSTMVGKDVTYVSDHLRGTAGTTFLLKIERPEYSASGELSWKPMEFKITRRSIQLPAVPYYGMLNDAVGYINLDSFTDDCSTDMRRAIIDLRHKGMKGLVFDLRGNGGGSLQEAVKIVNMFVPKGITIVKQRGKMQRTNREYVTTEEPIDSVMPLVVLVDENTASASEITAGSLQDLDRATILGTKTYGKGLVQMPMDLPYNATMKVTTSKYYIPSGRCVQAYQYKRGTTEVIADSLKQVFYTKNGREVRDGSGVMPDIEVKPDSVPNIAYYLTARDSSEVVHDWVVRYIATHSKIAPAAEFSLTDAEYEDFKKAVVASDFKYDQETSRFYNELVKIAKFEGYYTEAQAEFDALKAKLTHNTERDLDINARIIRQLLEADIVGAYYQQAGVMANEVTHDKQVLKAIEVLQAK